MAEIGNVLHEELGFPPEVTEQLAYLDGLIDDWAEHPSEKEAQIEDALFAFPEAKLLGLYRLYKELDLAQQEGFDKFLGLPAQWEIVGEAGGVVIGEISQKEYAAPQVLTARPADALAYRPGVGLIFAFDPQRMEVNENARYEAHRGVELALSLINLKGGKGSGNFGHAGRPGKVGGSAPESGRILAGGGPQTDSPEFRRWFDGSKVVDENGNPLVVYHGTPSKSSESNNRYIRESDTDRDYPEFETFHISDIGTSDSGWLGRGVYFTPDPGYAWEFGDRIIPAYVALKNPFIVHDDGYINGLTNDFEFRKSLQGIDGLPDELKLRTDMPEDEIDQFARWNGTLYNTSYYVEKVKDDKGGEYFAVTSSVWGPEVDFQKEKPTYGSIVLSHGYTKEAAVSNFWDKKRNYDPRGPEMTVSHVIGSLGFRKMLEKAGYDGVISYRVTRDENFYSAGKIGEMSEVVAFYPEQIKSAIANEGTFDPTNPSILKESSLKGGVGSGNFGHEGRPGKVGGSAPGYRGLNAGIDTSNPAFRQWFGNSKVIDENGNPKVVYHGTPTAGFSEFDPTQTSDEKLSYGQGIYVTESSEAASGYAEGVSWGAMGGPVEGKGVYPLYARIENPFDMQAEYSLDLAAKMLGEDNPDIERMRGEDVVSRPDLEEDRWNLEQELDQLPYKDYSEEVNPEDYDFGIEDEDYKKDLAEAKAYDERIINGRIARINKAYEQEIARHRTPTISGKDLYASLWKNSTTYHDWKLESQLFGGESDTMQFKTEANEILADFGFDGITHIDKFNPGAKGKQHRVWIAFNPNQVKSAFNSSPTLEFTDLSKEFSLKGGPGSGNFSHSGRPGKVGGSAPAHSGSVSPVIMRGPTMTIGSGIGERTVSKHVFEMVGKKLHIMTGAGGQTIDKNTPVKEPSVAEKEWAAILLSKLPDAITTRISGIYICDSDDVFDERFMTDASKYGQSFSINSVRDIYGYHDNLAGKGSVIVLRRKSFEDANLFYHEVGHAILNHSTAKRAWKIACQDPNFDRHTWYSNQDYGEAFSESFMAYMKSKGKVSSSFSPAEAAHYTKTFDVVNRIVTGVLSKKEAILEIMRIKGGPGSGNFSHSGRPGKVGGSMPRGINKNWKPFKPEHWVDPHRPENPLGDESLFVGPLFDLEPYTTGVSAWDKFMLSEKVHELAGIDEMSGLRVEIFGMEVVEPEYDKYGDTDDETGTFHMTAKVYDTRSPTPHESVGDIEVTGDLSSMSCEFDYFSIHSRYQKSGFGSRWVENLERVCFDLGIYRIGLHANISVGGYTWARMGLDFDDDRQLDFYKEIAAKAWKKRYGRKMSERMLDAIEHSWDIAMLTGRDGYRIGKQDVLLGSDWTGVKNLDDDEVGREYYASKKRQKG